MAILDCMWPEDTLVTLMVAGPDDTRIDTKSFRIARERQRAVLQSHRDRLRNANVVVNWPPDITRVHRVACMSSYFRASQFARPLPCAVCGQCRVDVKVRSHVVEEDMELDLDVLQCADDWLMEHPCQPFVYPNPRLDGLVLDVRALRFAPEATYIDVCPDCDCCLRSGKLPRLSLRNGLYRGELPAEFRDLSWVEEQICAINAVTCKIIRLHGSSNPENPFVLYGNTCVHPLNVVETAKLLPRSATDIAGRLGVIFVGPKKYKPKALGEVFRVRRSRIMAFLQWLVVNNKLYSRMRIDRSIFDQYPEDGPLPGLDERIVYREVDNPEQEFSKETSGLDDHPAMAVRRIGEEEDFVFMEALGLTDPQSLTMNARTFDAAALANLLPLSMRTPDLTFHRGSQAVPEYGNCDLFPSLFPKLYPFGIGGFEDRNAQGESLHVGFRSHASYLLNMSDRAFSGHRTFVFLVVNILQRRTVHSQTSFRTRSSYIDSIAPELLRVTPEQISKVSRHLELGGTYATVAKEDSNVLNLLRVVEAVAAKVPGTHGAKVELRRSIFAYARHISIPQVFFTMNPNPVHNPLFHLMCGDTKVDLSQRFPSVADAIQRSLRVAADPAAAADFFDLSIKLIFEHLFGWDYEKKRSKPGGGILGELAAFSISIELTGRGKPHAHILIWLKGAPNPRQIRERLRADSEFQDRFFRFWDAAIHHHLPTGYDNSRAASGKYDPREERPPEPPLLPRDLIESDMTPEQTGLLDDWEDSFLSEVKYVGEKTQRHEHKEVCYDYGHKDCRFLFPHKVEEKSYYDATTNSIVMRALESDVNYFNPEILVMTRCNHDMKCILSGGDTQAAVYYITNYITKLDVNDRYLLSLMTEAVETLRTYTLDPSLRTMLHRCLARVTRSLQLHAQQAVRYIRGRKDYILSHDTVPMMSAVLMKHVKSLYRVSELGADSDPQGQEPVAQNEDFDAFDDEESDPSFAVYLDADGNLRFTNQLEDYVHRPRTMQHLCFYDFVSLVKCVRKTRSSANCEALCPGHSLSESHVLQYRHSLGEDDERVEFIPLIIGTKVPRRSDSDYYKLFCLAHFKPFDGSHNLVEEGLTVAAAFSKYSFSAEARMRMQNWEDLYECEDQRDADRLRMQASKSRNRVREGIDVGEDAELAFDADPSGLISEDTARYYTSLHGAGWFKTPMASTPPAAARPIVRDDITEATLRDIWKTWRKEMKEISNAPRSTTNLIPDETDAAVVGPGSADAARRDSAADPQPDATTVIADPGPVPEFTREYAIRFAESYNLNPEQLRAYKIIASWLHDYVHSAGTVSQPRPPPLRMILHGAGGTGKTYSLKPLQDVLETVRFSDAVARLAPTGSAASLIDGSTVHAAIKLRVMSQQGDGYREFEVSWSPADRKHIQEMFGSAVLVLLDEFSLASTKMLGQIDVALRVARQNWSEPFGGMSVVLSGDLCQYEPVSGSALWTPLSFQATSARKGDDDSLDRLGRIAYKTFDTVVEFTRQERMREDPAFAAAVNRLRMRQCVPADVQLFNTRLVKSDTNPQGVDLDDPSWAEATTIVTRNDARRVINTTKARSYGSGLPRFFEIAANDRITVAKAKISMTSSIRKQVLAVKLKAKRAQNTKPTEILPGRLVLYEGMPVLLRRKNVSVYFKATNGAQGILRGMSLARDEFGEHIARLALVEFPGSPARLTGLPPGVVPLAPLTCTFPVCIATENQGKVWATAHRKQIAVEGAFCITGHAAQGKTLARVICCPACRCGFYIYVTFSRPRRLDCLALLCEVTLEMLNEPLDRDLRFELTRLAALAHNTAVLAGDLDEPAVPVPQHERERYLPLPATVRAREVPDKNPRKRLSRDDEDDCDEGAAKRRKVAGDIQDTVRTPTTRPRNARPRQRDLPPDPPFLGPTWDSENWSCAYDSVFVGALSAWRSMTVDDRIRWSASDATTHLLHDAFQTLLRPVHLASSASVVHYRDVLRRHLNSQNPLAFPLAGAVTAEIHAVLHCMLVGGPDRVDIVLDVTLSCPECSTGLAGEVYIMPMVAASTDDSLDTAQWFHDVFMEEVRRTFPLCCENAHCTLDRRLAPPMVSLTVDPRACVKPSIEMRVPGGCYRLCAVIYVSGDVLGPGTCHFLSAILNGPDVFAYDGMLHEGRLQHVGLYQTMDLRHINGAKACQFPYALSD